MSDDVKPATAPVRPRVRRLEGGEPVFLEDEVRDLLAAGHCGVVAVSGPNGSGKSVAIAHLSAVVADERLRLLDSPGSAGSFDADRSLVVYTTGGPLTGRECAVFALEPWGEDDWIEYLLARHKDRCGSVLERLHASPESDDLLSLPETCAPVLDALATDDGVPDALAAIERAVDASAPPELRGGAVSGLCLLLVARREGPEAAAWPVATGSDSVRRLLRHAPVRHALAAANLARALAGGSLPLDGGPHVPPVRLAVATGRLLARDSAALARVEALRRASGRAWEPLLATALHHASPSWRPDPGSHANLAGALLSGVSWPEIDLTGATLAHAELIRATLFGARLTGALAKAARLDGARLGGADLQGIRAHEVRFDGADLAHANLSGGSFDECRFDGAVLRGTRFVSASLHRASMKGVLAEDSDFSGATAAFADFRDAALARARLLSTALERADLRGAVLAEADATRADLRSADLEAATAPGITLVSARLDGADLTSARCAGAKCAKASFFRARMAEVDLSGADLSGADFREVEFHLGSARSGLVSTPIASEGTRTGLYSDDFLGQSLFDPDSIRKADLRGADLCGAKIDGTDFFLVDLRGALLDPWMVPVLQGMRAIL